MFSSTFIMSALKDYSEPFLVLNGERLIQPTTYTVNKVNIYTHKIIFFVTDRRGQTHCAMATEFNFPPYIKKLEDLKEHQHELSFEVQEILQDDHIGFRLKPRLRLLGGGGCQSSPVESLDKDHKDEQKDSAERLLIKVKKRIDNNQVDAVRAYLHYTVDRMQLLFQVMTGPCTVKVEMLKTIWGDRKINADEKDSKGKTLLAYCVSFTPEQCSYLEMLRIVHFLLENGATPQLPDEEKPLLQILKESKQFVANTLTEKFLIAIEEDLAIIAQKSASASIIPSDEIHPLQVPTSPDGFPVSAHLKISIPPTPLTDKKITLLTAAEVTSSTNGLLTPPEVKKSPTREAKHKSLPEKHQKLSFPLISQQFASPTETHFSTALDANSYRSEDAPSITPTPVVS